MKNFVSVLLLTFVLSVSIYAQDEKPFIGGGGIVNDKAIYLAKPEFPAAAKAVGAEGLVNVQVTIDEEGNVSSAKGVSGHPLLRKSSEKAALASKFKPTLLSGKAVKVAGVVVYNFVAEKKVDKVKQNIDEIKGEVLNGKAVSLPTPKYPAAAKAVKASGTVIVEIIVDEEGAVTDAKAVSGHALLRKEAMKAALKAKFEPTLIDGKAVKTKGVLVYKITAE